MRQQVRTYVPRVEILEREPLLASSRAIHAGSVDADGALVFVSGEAGIGKTALTRASCDGLPVGTAVRHGFCDALDTPRALRPAAPHRPQKLGRAAPAPG